MKHLLILSLIVLSACAKHPDQKTEPVSPVGTQSCEIMSREFRTWNSGEVFMTNVYLCESISSSCVVYRLEGDSKIIAEEQHCELNQ